MPLYSYAGQQSSNGKKIKGSIEAESLKEAKAKLRRMGIYVLNVTESSGASAATKGASLWQTLNRNPPKPEDLALATRQFAILTKAAVDISECLKSISEQVSNQELRSVYARVRELVSEGKSLSDAHKEFPKVFPPLYVNMLAAAERAGALPTVLKRLADFTMYQIEIRRKVVGALTYPAMMIIICFAVTIFLFVSVLPKMTKAFASLKVTLPWYSILLNHISAWMQEYWLISVSILAGAIGAFVVWSKTPKGSYKTDKFLLEAPVIGPVIEKVTISRFSKTLSTVLSAGVRIVEGLTLTRNVLGNKVLEEAIDQALVRVQDGEKLAAALDKTGRFPALLIQMLRTGEKTGRIEEMLTNIAETYDGEVDQQIAASTKLIEPAMMIFMAGLVVVIVMAVMGPMMQAMNSLK